ncbi:MAG: hypothetical protein WB696_30420, partial [Chthoniobacterales bacterium]
IELVVLMGTLLGIKGVSLDERVLRRIESVKRILAEHKASDRIKISADGGIRVETVPKLRQAGTDIITPGSLLFKSHDLQQTTSWIRGL